MCDDPKLIYAFVVNCVYVCNANSFPVFFMYALYITLNQIIKSKKNTHAYMHTHTKTLKD